MQEPSVRNPQATDAVELRITKRMIHRIGIHCKQVPPIPGTIRGGTFRKPARSASELLVAGTVKTDLDGCSMLGIASLALIADCQAFRRSTSLYCLCLHRVAA